MPFKTHASCRLVRNADLNHHGTLFAGQTALWFVESGFIAASSLTLPERILCVNIHGMQFKRPVRNGQVIRFESRVVLAGTSRLVAHVRLQDNASNEFLLEGFISFVHVDSTGKPAPHGITLAPTDPDDVALQERARAL
ncbi:MAG TPA: hotdog domain-containing protein [Myxococcota bacterium]|nr:hotdog domain-containing protein [Myxococcota bacterium]HRY92613.1 hotdog domain-containing protein [Myxococcota bacterium]HSA20615.1 hotdog domain-containing protein [Myxococcota bacterium]